MEALTYRQAADAVHARVDVKYLLGLDLSDPGFDFTVLSEFRSRLVEHRAECRLFELLVAKLSEQGYIKKRGIQRDFLNAYSSRRASVSWCGVAPGDASSRPQ